MFHETSPSARRLETRHMSQWEPPFNCASRKILSSVRSWHNYIVLVVFSVLILGLHVAWCPLKFLAWPEHFEITRVAMTKHLKLISIFSTENKACPVLQVLVKYDSQSFLNFFSFGLDWQSKNSWILFLVTNSTILAVHVLGTFCGAEAFWVTALRLWNGGRRLVD